MTKVMIVDDSSFMRKIFKKTIEKHAGLEVIATAADGQEALELIKTNRPDAITLDVDMPVKNGLETLKEIMKMENPIPTIMVSAIDDYETVMKALELGAFDFIPKPDNISNMDMDGISKNLILKIKAAVNMKVARPVFTIKTITPIDNKIASGQLKDRFPIITIGTSSGGPKALKAILPALPANFPAAILIVQHMPAGFTKSFAERLNKESKIPIKEAEYGDIIKPGEALLAPADYHMLVGKDGKIILDQSEPKWSVRPCVDYLFQSTAHHFSDRVIGVILTGMGRDGAEGMKAIKEKGGYGIIESEETALVYGMPGAAIDTGAYDEVVPLDEIPQKLIDLIERRY